MDLMCNFVTGTSYLVQVTHINDPGSFYVRSASLNSYVEKLEVPGEPLTYQNVDIGKRVIYNSMTKHKFVRGCIEAINFDEERTTCVIKAIDYGCLDRDVPLIDIHLPKSASSADTECPPMATHCKLYFCHPIGDKFEQNAVDTMKFFVGSHPAKMIVQSKSHEKLIVDLKTVECPDNLSTMLAYMDCSQLMAPGCPQVNRFDSPNAANQLGYKPKSVKLGDRLHVRVQSGDSIKSFYVADMNDHKKYMKSNHAFTVHCRRQPEQDVIAAAMDGRCCGIRYTSFCKYERGFVKKVNKSNNTCTVKLIDLGIEMETKCGNVHTVSSKEYTEEPAIAIHCTSTEDQMWNNGMSKFLNPGYQFFIDIVELGNDDVPHKVKLLRSTAI